MSPHVSWLAVAVTFAACSSTTTPLDGSAPEADASADTGAVDTGAGFVCPERSEEFPWESQFVSVQPEGLPRLRIRYVETGSGSDVFVLLHGIPTSSYLWRNVIPGLTGSGRVVVPDLAGFGESEHPERTLSFAEHAAYVGALLDALAIERPILVVHDLGSVAGLVWASQNPNRVAGLVMMESVMPPAVPAHVADSPSGCTSETPDSPACFWLFLRSPMGQTAIIEGNLLIDGALAADPFCPPTPGALANYRERWQTAEDRRYFAPLPAEIPVDGEPASQLPLFEGIARFLETSESPKLVLYANPGFLVTNSVAAHAAANFPNTEAVLLGPGFHFLQETHPVRIADAIRTWHARAGTR